MSQPLKKRLKRLAKGILGRPDIPMIPQTWKFNFSDASTYHIQHFGDRNADRVFYVVAFTPGGGFFSNVSYVINHLKIAHTLGFTPVVDMENFPGLYNEQDPGGLPPEIRGITNAWEYYFHRVSPQTLAEVYESKSVVFTDGGWPASMTMNITSDTTLPPLVDVYSRYVRPKEHVTSAVTEFERRHFAGAKVLGVHFRGQEMRTTPNHSFPPTIPQMLRAAHRMVHEHGFDRIFVVSEEQGYVDAFVREFGDNICSRDIYRTHGVNSYHQYPRANHRYLLGYDVLVDALLLSRCAGLLCSDSNVSEFARFVAGSRQVSHVIDNGVNVSNRLLAQRLWFIKRVLPGWLGGFRTTSEGSAP